MGHVCDDVVEPHRALWNPGYFHPYYLVDGSSLKKTHRSLSDQTPSPSCISALVEESKLLAVGGRASSINNTNSTSSCSSCSSLYLSSPPPSPNSYVSDSSTSSSEASISGDKLKKRRKYRRKRGGVRRSSSCQLNSPGAAENRKSGSQVQCSSPSAAYCEEWIYTTLSKSLPDQQMHFPGLTSESIENLDISTTSDDILSWRHTLDGDATTSAMKKNPSWLNIWQNWLKVAPKTKTKTCELSVNYTVTGDTKLSPLPSISEVDGSGHSETYTPTSSPFPSRKTTTTTTKNPVDTNSYPTKREVCLCRKIYQCSTTFECIYINHSCLVPFYIAILSFLGIAAFNFQVLSLLILLY